MDWFLYDNGLRHERVKAIDINSAKTCIFNWTFFLLKICFPNYLSFLSFFNLFQHVSQKKIERTGAAFDAKNEKWDHFIVMVSWFRLQTIVIDALATIYSRSESLLNRDLEQSNPQIFRTPQLQNRSNECDLTLFVCKLNIQKQPPEVFCENRCS